MDEELGKLVSILSDTGCEQEIVETARRLFLAGQAKELIRQLRLYRCSLMDTLHESQKRVDRLDYLIRHTEKTINVR